MRVSQGQPCKSVLKEEGQPQKPVNARPDVNEIQGRLEDFNLEPHSKKDEHDVDYDENLDYGQILQ